MSNATNSAAGILCAPTFACTFANIEVDTLAEFPMEIDVHQLRIDIASLIKQSKLTKNSTAIMDT